MAASPLTVASQVRYRKRKKEYKGKKLQNSVFLWQPQALKTCINFSKSLPLRFVQRGILCPQLLFWPLSSSTCFQTSDFEGELCLSISVTFLKPAIGKRERLCRPPPFPRLVFTALAQVCEPVMPTRKKQENYLLFWRRAASGICSLIGNKNALLHK